MWVYYPTIMENQMEKQMENEMEARGFIGVCLGIPNSPMWVYLQTLGPNVGSQGLRLRGEGSQIWGA